MRDCPSPTESECAELAAIDAALLHHQGKGPAGPPSRRNLDLLHDWICAELAHFNATHGIRVCDSQIDFLVSSAQAAASILAQAAFQAVGLLEAWSPALAHHLAGLWSTAASCYTGVLLEIQAHCHDQATRARGAEMEAISLRAQLRQVQAMLEEQKAGLAGPLAGQRSAATLSERLDVPVLLKGDSTEALGKVTPTPDAAHAEASFCPTASEVEEERKTWQRRLAASRQETLDALRRLAEAEAGAEELSLLRSGLETAEAEREDAQDALRSCTPRPPPLLFQSRDDAEQERLLWSALKTAPAGLPTADLARWLLGGLPAAGDGTCGSLHTLPDLPDFADLRAVLEAGAGPSILTFLEAHHELAWGGDAGWGALPSPRYPLAADFFTASTAAGVSLPPELYGLLEHRGLTAEEVEGAILCSTQSTARRYAALHQAHVNLHAVCAAQAAQLEAQRQAELKRDIAKQKREEMSEKKHPIQDFVEVLAAQPEEAWATHLIGMGQSNDVPRLFRVTGKVRNKNMSKRETEKLVKEVWALRVQDPAVRVGKAPELVEFLFTMFQKRMGIMTAVTELAYSFLYGLWKYQWDADCELFLKILMGEVKEDVYFAQLQLQDSLKELLESLDRAQGAATGTLKKEDLRVALHAYFRVGLPGGKTLQRFDELMQALDEDQPGPSVQWATIFEEDREFNQGEFAESVRDQFLCERIEYFNALEEALYEEAGHAEECSVAHIARALMAMDSELSYRAASLLAAGVWGDSASELMSVKLAMKRVSRGTVKKGPKNRASSARASVLPGRLAGAASKGKSGLAPQKGARRGVDENVARALEAIRQSWLKGLSGNTNAG
uniref:Translin-associated factor X-interacting protein 1 n=2 Tax=Auxenochlorella protothecoides TaxID=3075 RepID=A0A1D2A8U0_AUXPR